MIFSLVTCDFKGRLLTALLLLLLLSACSRKQERHVIFRISGAFHRHFVIQRAGLNGEKPQLIDSGVARSNRDSFVYTLPLSEPAVYWIMPQYKDYNIPFVHDSSGLIIVYNYNKDQYHFENSPASEQWRRLQQGGQQDEMRYLRFADTTTNPALFLLAYGQLDFDRDYSGLEKFIEHAGQRFPTNTSVQTLVHNTLDYVRIFRSPLRIGDTFPSLQLPDSSGRQQSIGPLKDKYLLVDCWSSWCESCRIFSIAKKAAWKRADTSRFAIVSIAVDAEKQAWLDILRFEHYPWKQVIDEKMWTGPAARTLHFDSLPYNFLIAPDGRILSRSIPADSLISVLSGRGIIRKHS